MAKPKSSRKGGKSKNRAATSSEPTETLPFRLLDLPPEIWSKICRLAVVFPDGVHAIAPRSAEAVALAVAQPGIIRVCRVIREEVLKTYYAENIFVLSPMSWGYTVSPIFHFSGLASWIAVGRDVGWWDWIRGIRVVTTGEVMEGNFIRRLEAVLRKRGIGVMWIGFEGAEVRQLLSEGIAGVRLWMRLV